MRMQRLRTGNWGGSKAVGQGVIELRINTGPGYRVYCARHGEVLVLLLCGGDKSSQQRYIKIAQELWAYWKQEQ